MIEKNRSSRRWIIALAVIGLAFAIWMIAGDRLWRRPDLVSDSSRTPVQPATVPSTTAGSTAPEPIPGDRTGDAARGQSATMGDGTPVNR